MTEVRRIGRLLPSVCEGCPILWLQGGGCQGTSLLQRRFFMKIPIMLGVFLVSLTAVDVSAQDPPLTNAFPVEESAERRARVMESIGDGLAVIHGAAEYPGKL
jgi:hypothetical protein